MDTFTTVWNRVLLRVPAAGPDLVQDLVRDSFNQLMERRQWSWLMKSGSFFAPNVTTTGTIAVTAGSAVINGTGTTFTGSMLGMQIRIAPYAYYTILQVVSSLVVIVDRPWSGPTLTAQPYTIAQVYFSVPSDFQSFYSVINPTGAYRLNHNATEAEFDSYDPQRTNSGIAYALAFLDFTQNSTGTIAPSLQVHGTGSVPVSTTALGYSYPTDSIYSVEITLAGASGTAQFRWAQDAGTTSGTNVVTSTSPIDLSNGVQVYFPVGTYNLGDVFVIACKTQYVAGVQRYELWPRPAGAPYTYPYQYEKKLPDLSDDQPQLPAPISKRGDVLVEMALTQLALWPGTQNQPNSYHDLGTSNVHRATAEKLIYELEKKDDDIGIKDLTWANLPFAGPWYDSGWLQTHAVYPYA